MDGLGNVFQRVNNQVLQFSFVAIIAFGFIFSSCNQERNVKSSLSGIDTYIDEHPDSALKAINAIDTNAIRSRCAKAKYALLKSIALDKNYIDTTDTRIIAPAVEYFRHHGSKDDRLKSQYYLGRIHYNAGDYKKAISTFSNALSLCDRFVDKKYEGLICTAISDTYSATYNDEESIGYLERALSCFKEISDTTLINATLFLKCRYYHNTGQWDAANSLYDMLNRSENGSKSLAAAICEGYAFNIVCSESPDFPKAVRLFEKAISESGGLSDEGTLASYAYSLSMVGRSEESDAIFEQLLSSAQEERGKIAYWESLCGNRKWDRDSYKGMSRRFQSYQDSVCRRSLSQSAVKAQRDYFCQAAMLARGESERKTICLVSAILLLLMSFAIVHLHWRGLRIKGQQRNDELVMICEELKMRLSLVEKSTSYKDSYVKLYKSQIGEVLDLCQEFLKIGGDGKTIISSKRPYIKLQKMMGKFGPGASGQAELERFVNSYFGNAVFHFREDYPKLKEEDYRFFCFIVEGFGPGSMSIMMCVGTPFAVSTRKNRMKKMIEDSSSARKDEYLLFF